MTASYEIHYTGNITEETLIHEAAHTSIHADYYNDPDWADAVHKDDSRYISSYARNFSIERILLNYSYFMSL